MYVIKFDSSTIDEHILYEKSIPDQIKLFVLERDRWACRSCNSDNGISPHHIAYRSSGRDHHPSNLVTVCFNCHRAIHDNELKLIVVDGEYFFGGRKRWQRN